MKESSLYAIAFIIHAVIITIISLAPSSKYLIGHILISIWFLTNYIINEIKDK